MDINPRAYRFTSGQAAALTAVPDAGQDFISWSGDATGANNPIAVVMDQTRVVTANFTKRPALRVGTPLEVLVEASFRLTLLGEFGTPYTIWGSTNFADWLTAGTVTNIYGTVQLTDPAATNLPLRFYRATEQ